MIILIYLIPMILDIFLMYHLHKEDINRYYKLIYHKQISTIGDLFKAMDMYLDDTIDDYIYDFVFDDGHIKNIYLVDKTNIARNKVQVIKQFSQKGVCVNRYDVTILVNGLPLVQVELKKRGVAIREAFNQIHRYSKESFNAKNSLYKYIQIFVISNGTDSRYFANTVEKNKNSLHNGTCCK